MGWTVECDFQPRKQFFARLLKTETNDGGTKFECLKHVYRGAPWKGTLYTVWRNTYKDGTTVTYGVVYLIELIKCRGAYERGWGYKDMEVSMGPNEVAFPLSWLGEIELTGYAVAWAERVREFWAKSKAKAEAKRAERKVQLARYAAAVAHSAAERAAYIESCKKTGST